MKKQSDSLTYIQACLVFLVFISMTTASGYHDYCIIGAGSGGLQLGYYLQQQNRDYIIYERTNISGSFYTTYPRHRTLISINKRHTGKTNKEFNLRHDWNSLLSDDESLLFRHYSKEMFPHADVLVKYLDDYTNKLNINVQYNTNVRNIIKYKSDRTFAKHGYMYEFDDQNNNRYKCSVLIIATGLWVPNIPDLTGIDYAEGYETMSINPDDYEGKNVLILGRGNSAFETADQIYGATGLIHMVGRSRVRLSWSTHYVGDLRAVNNALLDTYQLKSLDGLLEASIDEVKFVKEGEKYGLQFKDEDDGPGLMIDNFALREPYDKIIRCLGFKFDFSVFNNNTLMSRGYGRSKKFPRINHDYQSPDNPGMYLAGAATHSLDFRKSAGGFIHGYRYTARALSRILDNRYHQVPWPSVTVPLTQMMNMMLKRINEASGSYQMFDVLADLIILNDDNTTFTYLEEVPVNLIDKLEKHTGHNANRMIVLIMQYGRDFSGPGNDVFRINRATGEPADAHNSNFLHPVFYYYERVPTEEEMKRKTETMPRPNKIHHIVEDFLTQWDGPVSHVLPLRRFLEDATDVNLRHSFAEDCMKKRLLFQTVPISCQQDFMEGQGLKGTPDLISLSKTAKDM